MQTSTHVQAPYYMFYLWATEAHLFYFIIFILVRVCFVRIICFLAPKLQSVWWYKLSLTKRACV